MPTWPYGPTMKVPETPTEERLWQSWVTEVSRRQFAVAGSDIVLLTESTMLGIGDDARTTREWALTNNCPPQRGWVRKIGYRESQRLLLLQPRPPSLLPADGVWLWADDLEADVA